MSDPESDVASGCVAIIGAGISGLTAAGQLAKAGYRVTVFDKGRGPGGRTSTRRADRLRFDHGAQYFTARDPRFLRQVHQWRDLGLVEPWNGRIAVLEASQVEPKAESRIRYVGVPAMNAIAKFLARDLDLRQGVRIEQMMRSANGWKLLDQHGDASDPFEAVVVGVPPEQARALLKPVSDLHETIRDVRSSPCWAVMLSFDAALDLPFDGAFVHQSSLSWVTRNSSKPERDGAECWVLHASPEWSSAHVEDQAEAVAHTLLGDFFSALGRRPVTPSSLAAHRWLYSIAENPLDVGCLWHAEERLGVCGDWCQLTRIEGAYLSGLAMADALSGGRP